MSKSTEARQDPTPASEPARCAEIADRGIRTSQDTIQFLSALIGDIAAGRITGGQANASCNAIGKMLKTADLEAKYGTVSAGNNRVMSLVHRASGVKQIEGPTKIEDVRMAALAKLSAEERASLGLP